MKLDKHQIKNLIQSPYFFIFLVVFLVGYRFDLLPFRLEALGVTLTARGLILGFHVCNGLVLASICTWIIRCIRQEVSLFRVSGRQVLILFVVLNLITFLHIRTDQTVYFWDNAGYWTTARNLAAQRLDEQFVWDVLHSTVTEEYNFLLAVPISLIMRLFGPSRAVFLFSISNLYTMSALWGLCAMMRRRNNGGLILTGFCLMIIYIGCMGFVDVAAAAMAIWSVVFYRDGGGRLSACTLSGVCLCMTFLLRRYFFFFACAFCLAAALEWLILNRRTKPWNLCFLYLSFAVCVLYFTPNFILDQVIFGNIRDLYSPYQLSLRYDFLLTCRYFGLIVLMVFLALAFLCILTGIRRGEVIFALSQAAACYIAFVLVQTHGQQHLLMYIPALALIIRSSAGGSKQVLPIAAAVISLWCFVPKHQPTSIQAIPYPAPLPSFTFYGTRREDIDALIALGQYVDQLSQEKPATAAVLSSSFIFNSEILSNLWVSLNLPAPESSTTILQQGTVDRVDALNWNIFQADYMIVGDPVQTHLGEENQEVVAYLAHDILDGTGFGTAYRELPESFPLQGGVTVRIYQKMRDLTQEEYVWISDRLLARYPEDINAYGLYGILTNT